MHLAPGAPAALAVGLPAVLLDEALHAGRLLVLVEVRLEGKGLVATLARVRLGGGVGLDVGAEVGLVGERLFADVAGERLLP